LPLDVVWKGEELQFCRKPEGGSYTCGRSDKP
jgi:hypothetical protein